MTDSREPYHYRHGEDYRKCDLGVKDSRAHDVRTLTIGAPDQPGHQALPILHAPNQSSLRSRIPPVPAMRGSSAKGGAAVSRHTRRTSARRRPPGFAKRRRHGREVRI
jgi:hypothetical protein